MAPKTKKSLLAHSIRGELCCGFACPSKGSNTLMSAQLFTSGICCFAYQAQQGTKRRLAPVLTHGPQLYLYHPVQYRDEEEQPRAFGPTLYPTEPEDHPPLVLVDDAHRAGHKEDHKQQHHESED